MALFDSQFRSGRAYKSFSTIKYRRILYFDVNLVCMFSTWIFSGLSLQAIKITGLLIVLNTAKVFWSCVPRDPDIEKC
jgi:hypothetical protein